VQAAVAAELAPQAARQAGEVQASVVSQALATQLRLQVGRALNALLVQMVEGPNMAAVLVAA
jgi:hypothetical protein